MSAVSMKLMPASSARWMIRMLSSWSLVPQSPNIIAPRHSLLTETPVRPRGRYSIVAPYPSVGISCRFAVSMVVIAARPGQAPAPARTPTACLVIAEPIDPGDDPGDLVAGDEGVGLRA